MSKTNFEFLDGARVRSPATRGSRSRRSSTRWPTPWSPRTSGVPKAAEETVVTIDPDSGEIRVYGQGLDEDGKVNREWDDAPDDSVGSPPRRPSR